MAGAAEPGEVFFPGYAAVVLAGGRSRRLGRDKASVLLGGRRLLDRVLSALAGSFDEVVVVGRAQWAEAPRWVRLFPDEQPGLGPLGGLATGLEVIACGRALVVGCDMPFLDAGVLRALLSQDADAQATVARVSGRPQPLLAVYDRRVGPIARRRLASEDRSLLGLLGGLDVHYVDLETEPWACFSVNTSMDLERAEAHLRRGGGT